MKTARGFTLIEMLVAVALFSSVMVIALGSLLAISTSDRKAQSLKTVINNLNFSIDSMARSIRTGTSWNCSGSSAPNCNGGNAIDFIAANGQHVYYKLETSSGTTCGQTGTIGCLVKATNSSGPWLPLTSPEVVIDSAASPYIFYVVGATPSDNTQPKLVITLNGYVKVTGGASAATQCNTGANQCSVFHLQTAVTQRIYDQ